MYSIQAHDGPVTGLTYSTSYIISVGGDDRICVWERFQGNLLNTIQLVIDTLISYCSLYKLLLLSCRLFLQDHAYSASLIMLTHNLLITSKQVNR